MASLLEAIKIKNSQFNLVKLIGVMILMVTVSSV